MRQSGHDRIVCRATGAFSTRENDLARREGELNLARRDIKWIRRLNGTTSLYLLLRRSSSVFGLDRLILSSFQAHLTLDGCRSYE